MDAGKYVATRSAPVSLSTQKLVRSCYLHLWKQKRDGKGQVLIMDLETHVKWNSEILFGDLRKTWGATNLDEVLREYDTQFVLTELPAKKKVVRDYKIADHPYMLAVGSNPRTSISVGLVEYVADPIALANTMCQISGSHTTV